MSYALLKPLTEFDYLAAEERASTKSEFLYGVIHAMAGASERHNIIALNFAAACHAARRGSSCRPFMGDMRLRLDGGNLYYYPDVLLVCDPQDADPMFKSQPCLLAEVTSPSTEGIDRREKLGAYLKIPSLREYLIIAQDRMAVELYQRSASDQGSSWHYAQLGAADSFTSVCMPLTLSVAQIYADVQFEPASANLNANT